MKDNVLYSTGVADVKKFCLWYCAAAAIAGVLMLSCASTQNLSPDVRSRTYEGSYTTVFNAVVQTVQDYGYFVNTLDRETGVVNTDYRTGGFWETVLGGGNFRSKIGVNIAEYDDGTVRVVAMIVREERSDDDFKGWHSQIWPKGMMEGYYEKFFDDLDANLR